MRPASARRHMLALAIALGLIACGPEQATPESTTIPENLTTTSAPPPTTTSTTSTTTTTTPPTTTTTTLLLLLSSCGEVDPVDLGFDPFYTQHCDALGLPVLGSPNVAPQAIRDAAEIVAAMVVGRPDLVEAMLGFDLRVGIIGVNELTTDMPEYSDLYTLFPGTDWNVRARGLGATSFIPLTSAAEENILCLAADRWRGESIMVHEFAHTVHVMGLDSVDATFSPRLETMFEEAIAAGLWANTYAATNSAEYFAEGVQTYFHTNLTGPATGDGVHNDINTREKLSEYDPDLHDLIQEVFGDVVDLPLCAKRG